ncbi:DUF4834 family protein [uncultured Prevotella sp.]|uniref:DUF4834 family protein n=1 Tax=uncultured Prevotella sp. TaxID=159272 RepID=UPI0027E284DE|nr:DUF4834 family protein [uncultured Prevotella sp.]
MAIFGLFLKSIFLVAIMVAVFIVGVVIYLYLRVRRVARTFTSARQGASSRRSSASSASSSGSGSYSSQQNTKDSGSFVNEELYDQRTDSEINRKIFSKDEGEYVEFEEVK